jgi:hypothetical protein
MKGDWKTNAKLVIDDEVVATSENHKMMSSSVSISLRYVDQVP